MTSREARWETREGSLVVAEPTPSALRGASDALADFYNDPSNAALLSNTVLFSPSDVVDLWQEAAAEGGRAFLLWCDGALVGDADFRNVTGAAAELAILIGPRARQGQGLGGRFVSMLLALGLSLGLDRVYVAIRPENEASLRLFARAGFVRDDSVAGRSYAEEDDDVCMVLRAEAARAQHADAFRAIQLV